VKVVLSALLFIASVCWADLRTDKTTVTDLGNNWYQHDQFGTFYDANNSDWYYHLDHGWIYVNEWDNNGTWIYVPLEDTSETESDSTESVITKEVGLGWMWTKAEHYPHLYNNEVKDWMYFNKDRKHNKYYSQSIKSYIPKKIKKIQIADDDTEKWKELLLKGANSLDRNKTKSFISSVKESIQIDNFVEIVKADFDPRIINDIYILIKCFGSPDNESGGITLTAVEFPITERVLARAETGELNLGSTPVNFESFKTSDITLSNELDQVQATIEESIGYIERLPEGEPYVAISSQNFDKLGLSTSEILESEIIFGVHNDTPPPLDTIQTGTLKAITATEAKLLDVSINFGDADLSVVADIVVSSKASGGEVKLTEITDRAEILQVKVKSGLLKPNVLTEIIKLKSISLPNESIVSVNVPETSKWQSDYVTVEGASLKFSGSASNVGDVVLENVNHTNIGTLSGFNLPEVTSGL
jgi:hypothetical protein